MTEPEIGDPIRFRPAFLEGALTEQRGPGGKPLGLTVTGRVVHINRVHRFFTVAYEVGGRRLLESFKF